MSENLLCKCAIRLTPEILATPANAPRVTLVLATLMQRYSRKRGHSPVVTVELGGDSDDEPPPEVLKRPRGRPKTTPKSIEFNIAHPPSPNLNEIKKALHDHTLATAHAPSINPSPPQQHPPTCQSTQPCTQGYFLAYSLFGQQGMENCRLVQEFDQIAN
ncbi:hypothetical protein BDV93DRAFT_510420 [Ceratobasidium sp. AG-I]|nr:hypothetical protein BDV93DRAFT_510420 [Ceratobasidium sp. AG-I]